MADLFLSPGDNSNLGVPVPFLQGAYWPGIDRMNTMLDGYGETLPLGGGSSLSRVSAYGLPAEGDIGAAFNTMVSQISGISQSSITYNFEGLLGPQGGPGPPGPPGIGITNYIGGTIPVDTQAVTSDVPFTNGIDFSDNGGGTIAWTSGILRYKGVDHVISAEATGDTNAYIYWDLNSANTTFKTTATLADTLGADRWAMCYNDAGTPYPSSAYKILHGGYIEASTIDTVHLNALAITTAKIAAGAVTATEIEALTITAAEIKADAITTSKINGLAVGTTEIANEATTITVSDTDENVTITSLGNPVVGIGSAVFEHSGTNLDTVFYHLEIDGVEFDHGSYSTNINSYQHNATMLGIHTPGAGDAVVEIVISNGPNWSIDSAQVYATEGKGK